MSAPIDKRRALLALLSDGLWHSREECRQVGGDRFAARLHESGQGYEYSRDFGKYRLSSEVPCARKAKEAKKPASQQIAELEAEVARLRAALSRVKPQFEFTLEGL